MGLLDESSIGFGSVEGTAAVYTICFAFEQFLWFMPDQVEAAADFSWCSRRFWHGLRVIRCHGD